jgi:lipoprotein-anchoring transpeptidase ErfK/SrfK
MLMKKIAFSLLLTCAIPFASSVATAEPTSNSVTEAAKPQVAQPATTAAPATTTATTTPKPLERRLVLNLKQRLVYVYEGDKAIAKYPVAIGKKGWETPKGNFKVIQMVKNPIWQNPWNGKILPPGPNSPLGERWIGFWTDGKNTIGFHGTPGEHVMGQAVSHGCVRMRNKDIKSMFDLVGMGAPVTVQ